MMSKTTAPLWATALITALSLPPLAWSQGIVQAPRGGWTALDRDNSFMQEVHYPASNVSLRGSTSVGSQIKGQIRQSPKPTAEAQGKGSPPRPATLVVNGVPMPLETDETGHFERPYAFPAGSNSIEVRSADGQQHQRVQFLDNGQAARAKLRVVLNWSSPGTDLDLHVISPSGQHCFYGNRVIAGGGALDVDVTTGYGPEIFATPQPERGTWQVYVNFYGGGAQGDLTTAQLTIITGEGTPAETRRVQRVPMRATGDLQRVMSFAVL
jgi:uncharacterized protein YfaP (DUF2135 family)